MLDIRLRLVLLLALAGCADEPKDTTPTLEITDDASTPRVDAFEVTPDPDDGVAPPLDARLPLDEGPVDQGLEPDPDAAPMPDMGEEPLLEGAVATVTVVQQPEEGQINVAVTRFVEPMPGQGDCQVVAVDPDDAPPVVEQLAAGPISIEGLNGGPYTFSLVGGDYQADRPIAAELFGPGTTVRASAAGALPFDLEIGAPADVTMQSPGAFATLPANTDLTVRWNGAGAEAALITVFPIDLNGPIEGNWIFCGAADGGSFTVPGADLRRVPQVGFPGAPNALVAVTRIRTVTREVGSNRAILTVTTSNGAPVVLE